MNELILKEFSSQKVVYQYLPEGKGEPGEIVYVFGRGNAEVVETASDDEFGSYAHKALNRVSEYINKNNLPMRAIQAWY
jgi:hypothetical protein